MRSLLLTTALFAPPAHCLCPSNARPQDESGPEDLTERFECPDGMRVTLWAESPALYNPTALDVDARGRVWVTEAVNYRRWGGRNEGREHPNGDRVVILEDTDGDGAADSSKVFVEDKELVAPLGICVLGERVIVSCSPHVFIYTDTDGDDRADSREVFLTGFGGFDHDHGVHSVVAGDDGYLYLATGNAGPHLVTGSDGFELRSGSIYSGGTPYNGQNAPGLESSDGHVWTGGLLLRVRPDGSGLAVMAHNFRNPYETALDSFGNLFVSDNDDDGNRGCRTTWAFEGGNYGFFSADGSRSWQADRKPDQEVWRAHWHADDPGVAPPGTINGAGGPTGVCVYESEFVDDAMSPFDGAVLNCDAGAGVVYAHFPARRGAGIHLDTSRFLGRTGASGRTADDGREQWFRPSDVVVQTDGSVLVADWYDPGVGGHGMGDRDAYGRILRVAPEGHDNRRETLSYELATEAQIANDERVNSRYSHLLNALCSPAVSVRARARDELIALGDEVQPALHELGGDPSARIAARAVFVLARLGPRGLADVQQFLNHPVPELRVSAFRALRAYHPALAADARSRLVRDTSPFVRAEVARALRDVPWEESGAELVILSRLYEGEDRYYLESLGLGAEGKEQLLYEQLAAARLQGALDEERFRELTWRLHPAAALPELAAWANDASLPYETRRAAIDALAFIPSREAADAAYGVAYGGPVDLRPHARAWVEQRAESLWRDHGLSVSSGAESLDGAERRWSSGVMRDGVIDIDVDVTGAEQLWLVVTEGGDGNSCDWAAWIAPRFQTLEGEVALETLGWERADAGYGQTRFHENCSGGPLRIGDIEFSEGIGTHAHSEILVKVPSGAQRFVAQAGPDYGGTSQGCGTSIEFEVWTAGPVDRTYIEELERVVLDDETPSADRASAVYALATDPEGALFLIELAEAGKLRNDLSAVARDGARENPDFGVRALVDAKLPRSDAGPERPDTAALVALEGNARRGEAVFFSDRATCSACHSVRGRGRDLGPDLTALATKYGPPEVFDAILDPSAAIAFGYDSYLVRTVDGILYAGFLLADAQDVVLKDTQGVRHVIPQDEVELKKRQEPSVMPQGVALGLTDQELADIVAFLLEDTDREPVFGAPIELFNGTDLAGWTYHLRGDARPEDVWSVQNGVLRCNGKPAGYLRTEAEYTNFELTLEWRFDPERGAGNSGVLLRMVGADKVWPKSIEAQLQSRHAGDIWNIDQFPMQAAPERTNGRRTTKREPTNELPLGGWNRYEIRLDRGELTLEVNGLVQNRASWCEEVAGKICLQSEGAYIEFRNVVLRPILE